VRDHELVAHCRDDHARNDQGVEVGVPVPCEADPVLRELEPALRDSRDVVEVQPPEGGGRKERDRERDEPHRPELELRRRCAGEDDRLAERNDHEQLEALREVRGLDLPRVGRQPGAPRDPVEGERREVVDRERGHPQGGSRAFRNPAGDPQHPGCREPGENRSRALPLDRPSGRRHKGQEGLTADLDRDVASREEQPARAERVRDRDREQEGSEHHPDQHEADDGRFRVELVRQPRRVVPRPPDDEQHEQRLPHALPGQMGEQHM